MELQEAINKYFSRDNIIDSICRYQLYYQIGLGSVALKSIQDLEETHKRLKELDLKIDSQKVFMAIYEIVLHLSRTNGLEKKFDGHLKFTALSQMLNDFTNADKELLNSKTFSDMIYEEIKNDTYFNYDMKQQFDADYKVILPSWEIAITDEIANDIKNGLMEIFNK